MQNKSISILLGTILASWLFWTILPASELERTPNERGYIDVHVHTAGIGEGDSGIYISQEMLQSWKFLFYIRAFGVTHTLLETYGDQIVLKKIAEQVHESKQVHRAVVLAMDGVMGPDGRLDQSRTQIFVPNEFLIRELPKYEELLFGASVNPYRKDALERLDHVSANGAVLVKWLPNIMHIDPADTKIKPYYKKLVELGLPLLTHTGYEEAFADSDDGWGDPVRLELPLSMGVTVIAAHIATTGNSNGQSNFERILPLFDKYPNLYADISSLTQVNKLDHLKRALSVPSTEGRLIYGSDWPLQFSPLVSPFYHLNHISLSEVKAVSNISNVWDRDVALKRFLGVPNEVFERSKKLLVRKSDIN